MNNENYNKLKFTIYAFKIGNKGKITDENQRCKIHSLPIEVDSRLEHSDNQNVHTRDLVSQLCQLFEAVNIIDICKAGKGPTPIDAKSAGFAQIRND